jgi:hypothetical protein
MKSPLFIHVRESMEVSRETDRRGTREREGGGCGDRGRVNKAEKEERLSEILVYRQIDRKGQ